MSRRRLNAWRFHPGQPVEVHDEVDRRWLPGTVLAIYPPRELQVAVKVNDGFELPMFVLASKVRPAQPAPVKEAVLVGSIDAMTWATEFVRIWPKVMPGQKAPEAAWLAGWFANSMMAMHDHMEKRHEVQRAELEAQAAAQQGAIRELRAERDQARNDTAAVRVQRDQARRELTEERALRDLARYEADELRAKLSQAHRELAARKGGAR